MLNSVRKFIKEIRRKRAIYNSAYAKNERRNLIVRDLIKLQQERIKNPMNPIQRDQQRGVLLEDGVTIRNMEYRSTRKAVKRNPHLMVDPYVIEMQKKIYPTKLATAPQE